GFLARLQRHRDGDRFFARLDAGAFVDVENGDGGDQFSIGPLRRPYDVARRHAALDHEREVAFDRLKRGEFELESCPCRLRLGLRDALQYRLEGDERPLGVERLERGGMQFAEMAEN